MAHGPVPRGIGPSNLAGKKVIELVPQVYVKDEESFENALRRFKRKCAKAGVLTELKKRQYF